MCNNTTKRTCKTYFSNGLNTRSLYTHQINYLSSRVSLPPLDASLDRVIAPLPYSLSLSSRALYRSNLTLTRSLSEKNNLERYTHYTVPPRALRRSAAICIGVTQEAINTRTRAPAHRSPRVSLCLCCCCCCCTRQPACIYVCV